MPITFGFSGLLRQPEVQGLVKDVLDQSLGSPDGVIPEQQGGIDCRGGSSDSPWWAQAS